MEWKDLRIFSEFLVRTFKAMPVCGLDRTLTDFCGKTCSNYYLHHLFFLPDINELELPKSKVKT